MVYTPSAYWNATVQTQTKKGENIFFVRPSQKYGTSTRTLRIFFIFGGVGDLLRLRRRAAGAGREAPESRRLSQLAGSRVQKKQNSTAILI